MIRCTSNTITQGVRRVGNTQELDLDIYSMLHGIFRALRVITIGKKEDEKESPDIVQWCKLAKNIAISTLNNEASLLSHQNQTSSIINHHPHQMLQGYDRRVVLYATVEMLHYISLSPTNQLTSLERIHSGLILLPMCMPGDEQLAKSILSNSLLSIHNIQYLFNGKDKNVDNTKKKEYMNLRTVLMEYYLPFFGDDQYFLKSYHRQIQEENTTTTTTNDSNSNNNSNSSNNSNSNTSEISISTSLFMAPRIYGEQQSTLPLPTHWLYLPMVSGDEEEEWNTIQTSVASLTVLSRVELQQQEKGYELSIRGLSTLSIKRKMYTIMRVAAMSSDEFLFDTITSTVLHQLLNHYEQELMVEKKQKEKIEEKTEEKNIHKETIEKVCGRKSCLRLAARVTRRYLNDPRCHMSNFILQVMRLLLSDLYFHGNECIRSIWQVSIEARLAHTLESVYLATETAAAATANQEDTNKDDVKDVTVLERSTDKVLVTYYASALIDTVGTRKRYCSILYGLCLSKVAMYVFGGDVKKNEFGRREIGMLVMRSGKMEVVKDVLEFESGDGKTAMERKEWLMVEEE